MTSCSTAILDDIEASFRATSDSGYTGPPQTTAVAAYGVAPAVTLAAMILGNRYTTIAAPTLGSPWTQTGTALGNGGHIAGVAGYVVNVNPADFVASWSGNPAHSRVAAVTLATAATAPVQSAQSIDNNSLVLAGAPTEGNVLIMFTVSFDGLGAQTGWRHLGSAVLTDSDDMMIDAYIRCVGAGESATLVGAPGLDVGRFVQEWTIAPAAPVADFTGTPLSGTEPLTVVFTDLSSFTPTSWTWTFGDGGTSTSQNPSHTYTLPGDYTVTLTATNAEGSDSESKTAYVSVLADVGYEPPNPAGVLLEIYTASPGSARWGVATWGDAVWSSAGWQDVTPEGVTVDIEWGSRRPELGVLAIPTAAVWNVTLYDPDRILDPANEDSPYHADLIPGLPIRVHHRGTEVRRGLVESIGHKYQKGRLDNGYIRATDAISRMAQAAVPSDTTLSDTLYARTVDALAAAGLSDIYVRTLVFGSDVLAPWVTGTNEWSAWDWIVDAAQQVQQVPIVNRTGQVEFRAWSSPLDRARALESPELVALQVISDYSGLYSVVQVRDDTTPPGAIIERALTPTPPYGKRTYLRDEPTPDADLWAEAVLADRALPGIRWVPGAVRGWTADDVELLATIQAWELVSLYVPEESPQIIANAIVVGGNIHIEGKRDSEAIWEFRYHLAQTATEPLGSDAAGADGNDYLLLDPGGDAFLFPD